MKKKTNLLIIEDDIAISTTIYMILKEVGYNITTASDGLTGLEILKENSFDIILLDLIMKPINGIETYKEIKKISPGINTIMITGHVDENQINEAKKEGINRIIFKPFDFDKLISIIDELCES